MVGNLFRYKIVHFYKEYLINSSPKHVKYNLSNTKFIRYMLLTL